MSAIKEQLLRLCYEHINQRIHTAQQAIAAAQASANEETKSSAGDKYETGRAMAQLEIEKNTVQLAESMKLKATLDQIMISPPGVAAAWGSLVITDRASYFIAISIGPVNVDGKPYAIISPASPIGLRLMGLKSGQFFTFNNVKYTVLEIN
ncbi:MAG: 3-oxoacyl-ACP synthase [Bacteroidota bacterium]